MRACDCVCVDRCAAACAARVCLRATACVCVGGLLVAACPRSRVRPRNDATTGVPHPDDGEGSPACVRHGTPPYAYTQLGHARVPITNYELTTIIYRYNWPCTGGLHTCIACREPYSSCKPHACWYARQSATTCRSTSHTFRRQHEQNQYM